MNIDENRFWSKVDRTGGPDACWDWTAGKFPYGYGAFAVDGRNKGAHVVAWMLTNGRMERPHGMQICHKCDRPSCCNPAHLFLGTVRDNFLDSLAKGRRRYVLKPASEHAEKMPRGTQHWAVKRFGTLDEDTVKMIRSMLRDGTRQCDIMRALDLPRKVIQRVASRRVWGHVA